MSVSFGWMRDAQCDGCDSGCEGEEERDKDVAQTQDWEDIAVSDDLGPLVQAQ